MNERDRIRLTARLQRAINAASRLHLGQVRKGDGDLPFISHPFAVAWIVGCYTSNEDTLVAALLHDVLEDVPNYYYEDLKRDFGGAVAGIVRELSEDKDPNVVSDARATWEHRKSRYLKQLANSSNSALLISAADKIHNLQSMIMAYDEQGDGLWEKFNSPPEKKLWFYEEVLKILTVRLHSGIVRELKEELEKLEALLRSF
ncbi:MAG: HD domain-containing protein [Syntrophales bacterium]|nr:HD domain-containing protein [Syntrophales bacterium]